MENENEELQQSNFAPVRPSFGPNRKTRRMMMAKNARIRRRMRLAGFNPDVAEDVMAYQNAHPMDEGQKLRKGATV